MFNTTLQYLVMVHNIITESKDAYEDNGNVIGVKYSDDDKKLASTFEKLDFNEKLDVFSEIIIRYDNETYFENKIPVVPSPTNVRGFDLTYLILK